MRGADPGRSNKGEEDRIHQPSVRTGARCVDDQHRETPHRPHDTRPNTLKVVEHSKPPLRLSAAPPRPARSTKTTTFRGRRPTYHHSLSSCNAARTVNPQPKLHKAAGRRPRPSHLLIRGRRPDIKPTAPSRTRRPSRQYRHTSGAALPPKP
jgi:hypothetical protein